MILQSSSSSCQARRQQQQPGKEATATAAQLVEEATKYLVPYDALLEFDGRRLHHRKEHRLALLLVPHFCLYHL
jgi:hypothetical protein